MSTHVLPARTLGRYTVEAGDGAARGVVVGFHGYGQDDAAMMDELKRAFGGAGFVLVSVMALHRFYDTRTGRVVASWMTKLDREQAIADNLAYVRNVMNAVRTDHGDLPLLFVGFSQGAAMAWRAAAAGLGARGVIVLGGDLPPDVDARSGALPPVLVGRGRDDTWYTAEKMDADLTRLRDGGCPVETCVFDGGHVWTDAFRAAASAFAARVVGEAALAG